MSDLKNFTDFFNDTHGFNPDNFPGDYIAGAIIVLLLIIIFIF